MHYRYFHTKTTKCYKKKKKNNSNKKQNKTYSNHVWSNKLIEQHNKTKSNLWMFWHFDMNECIKMHLI